MALIDEVRMDKTFFAVAKTEDPSDAKEYWKSKTIQERLAALELTRQIFHGYDPDTEGFQRVFEVVRRP